MTTTDTVRMSRKHTPATRMFLSMAQQPTSRTSVVRAPYAAPVPGGARPPRPGVSGRARQREASSRRASVSWSPDTDCKDWMSKPAASTRSTSSTAW